VSTISREVTRNRDGQGRYRASAAQVQAYQRACRPKPAKLAVNGALRQRVEQDLGKKYSPEQIAGRLRADFPDHPEMWVSTETIYQSLYVQSRGALRRELTAHLRTGRALRSPSRKPGQRKNRIPDMINISQRPPEVADRAVPGHWEGDLIIGKRNLSAIGTLVERTTGYTMLLHLPEGYRPEQVRDALAAKIQTLPETLRGSLTWDQGPEMRDWHQVAVAADIDISSATRTRPGSAAPTRTPTGCCGSTPPRAPTSPCIPRPSWTRSPPNSTTGPANGSDSANRSRRSLTCFWLCEEHPAQPRARPHLQVLPHSGQRGCRAGGVQMEPPQPRSGEEERP
jgi:IS30 family transposase